MTNPEPAPTEKKTALEPPKEKLKKPLGNRRPTLKDVAETAGVSVGAASDILNRGRAHCYTPATQEKVREAVKELAYIPSRAAQNLRRGSSNTVVVIVPQSYRNPFYARVAEGLDLQLVAAGLEPHFICLNGKIERIENEMPLLVGGGFAAAIAAPIYGPKNPMLDHLATIFRFGTKVMALGSVPDETDVPFIQIKDAEAGRLAVDYLYKQGHRAIGLLGAKAYGPVDGSAYDVEGGVTQNLTEKKLFDFTPKWVFRSLDDGTYVGIMAAANQFVEQWEQAAPGERPTVMICKNDQAAMALLSVCYKKGINVPEDLSILGYDNIPETEIAVPAITTVDGRVENVTQAAVNKLLKILEKPLVNRVSQADLEPIVIERQSVKKIG